MCFRTYTIAFTVVLLCLLATDVNAGPLDTFKNNCEELGFVPKTDKFIDCVLELRSRAKEAGTAQQKNDAETQAEQRRQQRLEHFKREMDERIAEIAHEDRKYKERLQRDFEVNEQRIQGVRNSNAELARLQAQIQAQTKFEADRRARRQGDALMRMGKMILQGGVSTRRSTMKNRTYIINGYHFNCTFTGNVTICN